MQDNNRYTEWKSLEQNLNAPGNLVDDRSVNDHLYFLSNFAELINFFDNENKRNGDWKPFLLKDPVFLTNEIAQTPWRRTKRQFTEYCKITTEKIPVENGQKRPWLPLKDHAFSQLVEQLFNTTYQIYQTIEGWTTSMSTSSESTDLKTYLVDNVQNTYAPIFWALMDLEKNLKKELGDYTSTSTLSSNELDAFNNKIWTTNKGKTPYWQVLNSKNAAVLVKRPEELVETLKTAGEDTLLFFEKVIKLAATELVEIKKDQSNLPDTVLLRSFVQLLTNYQAPFNELTGKHLDFYYTDILRQHKKQAVADQVYACATLSGKNVFTLGEGTAFTAGNNAKGSPILFSSNENTAFNPGKLASVMTLFVDQPNDGLEQLYLASTHDPGVIQRDEDGYMKGWPTFGKKKGNPVELGMAIASPLLLLKEGVRNIELTITFADAVHLEQLLNASLFLSTGSKWWSANARLQSPATPYPQTASEWTLTFILKAGDPPIEPFEKPVDGIQSKWPLFKLILNAMDKMASPPRMKALTIKTNVTGIKSLTLSNDNGALNPAKPFQPFGPVADNQGSFFIGSQEAFSKPLNYLNLELDWDKIVSNLETYYEAYNKYLWKSLQPNNTDEQEKNSEGKLKKFLKSVISAPFKWIKSLFPNKKEDDQGEGAEIVLLPVFYNQAFKVNYEVLTGQEWQSISLERQRDCSTNDGRVNCEVPYYPDTANQPLGLFNATENDPNQLADQTFFSYGAANVKSSWPANPAIQLNQPFELTDQTKSGFVKMTLTNPPQGFGSDIYGQVVSAVALYNADEIVRATQNKTTPNLINAPNPPYIPVLKGLKLNYSASQTYQFDYAVTNQPIECYHFSVFENYLVYSSSVDADTYADQIASPIFGTRSLAVGLPVFPDLSFDGVFMAEMTGVKTPGVISFLLELAATPGQKNQESADLSYFYLSKSGWQPLEVISDETKGFTCSGIIAFHFPKEFTADSIEMPKAFWWGVGLTGKTSAIADTVFFQSNAFKLTRMGADFEWDTTQPSLAPNGLTGPQKNIPELASVVQPFASFGGIGAETADDKNLRVSNRLKTKRRAVTQGDYMRIIQQNFDAICYSKVNFNAHKRTVNIHLVKKVESADAADAFLPLVNKCLQNQVQTCLENCTGFNKIQASNFHLNYVTVRATVYIRPEFELKSTAKRITQALKVFLSPWIESSTDQITIDQGISDVQVAQFIDDFYEVVTVEDIKFQLTSRDEHMTVRSEDWTTTAESKRPDILLVPDQHQLIHCKSAV